MSMRRPLIEQVVKGIGGLWGGSDYEKLKEQYGATTNEQLVSNDYSPLYNEGADGELIKTFNDKVMTGTAWTDATFYWGIDADGWDRNYGMNRAAAINMTDGQLSGDVLIPPTNKYVYTRGGDPINSFVPNVNPSTNPANPDSQLPPQDTIKDDFAPDSTTGPMGEIPGSGNNSKASTFKSAQQLMVTSRFQPGAETLGQYIMGRSSDAWYEE